METLSELILLLGQFLSDLLNYLMHSISVYIQTSLESISPSSSEISSNAPWSGESYVGRLTGLFFCNNIFWFTNMDSFNSKFL